MPYTITIIKEEVIRTTRPKEWKLIGSEDNAQYGYTPEVETLVQKSVKVLEQTVDYMNLHNVIRAVNGIA